MTSLTIHFGAGFVVGLGLSFVILFVAAALLVPRILAHIKSHDRPAYRTPIIDAIATFVAEIVSHPRFVDALSRAVEASINRWIASPESRQALWEVYQEVPKKEMGLKLGKDAAGYVKNFGLGVVDTVVPKNEGKAAAGSATNFDPGVADDVVPQKEPGRRSKLGKDAAECAKTFGLGIFDTVKESRKRV